MSHILRWPAILVLFALVLFCALGALAGAGVLTGFDAPIAQVQDVQAEAAASGAGQATWLDVGLFSAAAIFFLIAAVRLFRRTQGVWMWLLGALAFGGRWVWAQLQSGTDLVATVQSIDPNVYAQPAALIDNTGGTEAQIGILAIVLIVGLVTFIVDLADRAYWDKQGA